MTQYIVYQTTPPPKGVTPPDPQVLTAGLTTANSPSEAVANIINSNAFPGNPGSFSVVSANTVSTFDVKVNPTVTASS